MPYNVNPPCPTSSKTLITWQFSGQPQKSSDAGDDYRIVSCLTNRYVIKATWTQKSRYSLNSPGQVREANGYIINHSGTPDLTLAYGQITSRGTPAGYADYAFLANPDPARAGSGYIFFPYGDSNNVMVAESAVCTAELLEVSEGTCRNDWSLLVLKNSQAIITDKGRTPPSASWSCKTASCPPNTCSVDCGSYICCYGADGISVFNYNK